MNNELQSWSDSLTKGTCFHCEEVALKNIELEKEVKALRLILQSHGEVVEMNAKLKEKITVLERIVSAYGNIAITGKIKE